MPKIDAMLRMMAEKGVERAVLRGDKPYQILESGRLVEASITPNQQLRALLEEIMPSSLAPSLRSGNNFHFKHPSPFGAFDMGVTSDLGLLEVTITPAKNEAPANLIPAPFQPPLAPQTPPLQGVLVDQAAWPPAAPASPPPAPHPFYPPPAPATVPPGYPYPYGQPLSSRSKAAAGLLALFIPGLGIHRFYLGYTGIGIAYVIMTVVLSWFTCGITAGIAFLCGMIEGIIILCGGMPDVEGLPLQ